MNTSPPPQQILLSGASGLVGSALASKLREQGHTIYQLVRRPPKNQYEISWDPNEGDITELPALDTAIHLSGEPIANKRWSHEQKTRILTSRVNSTRLLVSKLSEQPTPPKSFLCASAIGYYGETGDTRCTEQSPNGNLFISEVCRMWEEEASRAESFGMRVVSFRIGIVLSTKGGALAKMLPPFKLGLGGPLGNGNQYMSWITLSDLVRAIIHCAQTTSLSGPVNFSSPSPVINKEFTRSLGSALRRPAIIPLPAFIIRLLLGQMGQELLLSSTAVTPQKLLESGFEFQQKTLQEAFSSLFS